MKIRLSDKKNVIYASKSIENSKVDAISTCLFMISGKKYTRIFRKILDKLVTERKNNNKFGLEGINQLHKKGFLVKSLEFYGKKVWREIDFPENVRSVNSLIY